MKKTAGFTLIELLVVIAIIGLLSSIIISSLYAATLKARDSAIISEVGEMRTLMEENNNDFGSYTNLQPNTWFPFYTQCNAVSGGFTGTYAAQATAICQEILANENSQTVEWAGTGSGAELYVGNGLYGAHQPNQYSIMAYLSNGNYYCAGSSGRTSSTMSAAQFATDGYAFAEPGCYQNP